MLPNDVSLLFLIAVIALVNGAILFATLRLGAPREPALYFIAGCLLLALTGPALFLPASANPLRAFGLNVPPLLSYAAWLAGMLLLCGKRQWLPRLLLATGLLAIAVTAIGFVPALRDERIALVTGSLALLRLATAAVLLRYGRGFDQRLVRVFAGVMLVEAAAMGHRATIALAGALPTIAADPLSTTSFTWLTMLASDVLGTPLLLLLGVGRVLAATRETAARYRATLEALPDAVLALDASGGLQSLHRGLALAGLERIDERRGAPLTQVLPAPLGEQAGAALTAATSTPRPLQPAVALDEGGQRRWLEITAAPQGDGRGQAGHVLILRDVSARVQAESDLRYRIQLLERLFVNSPIGLLLSDAHSGRLLEANPALLTQCGWRSDDLLSRRYPDLLQPGGEGQIAAVAQGLASHGRFGPFDGLLSRGDGGSQPVRLSAFTLLDAGGRALVWTLAEDIAERERATRLKNELVSVVSHELRTPLTSITGALGLVMGTSAEQIPETARRLLQVASDNCRRLRLLVDDLLDLDRLIAGKLQLALQAQPLAPLLTATVEAIRPFASSRSIQLEAPDGAVQVDVDAARFQQILSNLLSNALKFSPEGAEVRVHTACHGARVQVVVSDRGPGVPTEFIPRLFERFAQADASDTRARGGSGLGLAIVRELSERMGGHAHYQPNPGGGAQFVLEFPLAPAPGASGGA